MHLVLDAGRGWDREGLYQQTWFAFKKLVKYLDGNVKGVGP